MHKLVQFSLVVLFSVSSVLMATGQEYRVITGEGNNRTHSEWGAHDSDIRRLTDAAFTDGISQPGALNRANPRDISNLIFNQAESIPEKGKHSDFIWVFGQFIDHDITLVRTNPTEFVPVAVPPCDDVFDPSCTGQSIIPVNRSLARPGSGTSIENPREYNNSLTSFIDASNVYGSDEERSDYLRTFEDGKLRMSHGDLLPFNTIDGEFNSGRDFTSPEMDMMNPTASKWFVAGDVRANENVLLTGIHTLFAREHNRWAELLKEENPLWSDETLYQEAKLRTAAVLQAIVYEEWLPTMGIQLTPYTGYSDKVNPSILKVFSVAAFRIGHTMLNGDLKRMMSNCDTHPNGDIDLQTAFFNPIMILQDGGIDPLLRGMAAQDMQEIDGRLVDDVRNFLFGPPGSGIGMDLAAINIQRGREMGLPDFNSVRKTFGLPPYSEFDELCSNQEVAFNLQEIYGDIDNIDPWVGMLCEDHMSDEVMFGRTIMEILKYQFTVLRDGDRFYYENDLLLSDEEKAEIKSTRLADVVRRNTELRFMQEDVFLTNPDCEHTNFVLEEQMLDAVVYPNPTRDKMKIGVYSTLPDAEMYVDVVDNMGRFVQKERYTLLEGMNIVKIDVTNLQAGNYLLHMTSGAAHNQQQFIKL